MAGHDEPLSSTCRRRFRCSTRSASNNKLYVSLVEAEPHRLLRRQDAAEPALLGAERDAGGAGVQPVAGHFARNGHRADGAAVRLRGERQLLAADSREVTSSETQRISRESRQTRLAVSRAYHRTVLLRMTKSLFGCWHHCGWYFLPSSLCFAGETRTWSQSDYADFEKGVIKNLSVRSDGLLTLAPHSHELFDTSTAYLWALARDSKGNLYAGGGTGAKLFRIPPGRQGQDAGRTGRARDPRHRRGFQRPRLRRHRARRQGLSHHRQRQTGSLLRSQDQVHLGAGLRQQGRPVRRHRRPGRDPPRDARRQGHGLLQDRRDPRALHGRRRQATT